MINNRKNRIGVPVELPAISSCSSTSAFSMKRHGFSLLEVILALALSALISGAIAAAIQVHLVGLKKQQESIERSHIARNVLEVMANDIRAAMQYKPFQTSEVVDAEAAGNEAAGSDAASEAAAAAGVDLSGAGAGGAGAGGAGAGGAGAGGAGAGGDAGGTPSPTENISAATVLEHPGFYGTQTGMVFDISRLPRLDQYNTLVVGENIQDITSDIKTTSYFLDTSGATAGAQLEPDRLGGLYRRQLDHAVARYANEVGGLSDGITELLATEIVQVAFRYFDGEEWVNEWDSDELGGFPTAVEIVLMVDQERKSGNTDYEFNGFDPETMKMYRKVVHLPIAEMLSQEELDAINGVVESSGSGSESGAGAGDADAGGDR